MARHLPVDLQAEEPLDVDVLGVGERVDVLRVDAELLGLDRGEHGPVDGLRPLGVAVGDRGASGSLEKTSGRIVSASGPSG